MKDKPNPFAPSQAEEDIRPLDAKRPKTLMMQQIVEIATFVVSWIAAYVLVRWLLS